MINEDAGREEEIRLAKLEPYDGETIYGTDHDGQTYFLGYELKRYRVYRKARGSWVIGTTIVRHTRVVRSPADKDSCKDPGPTITIDYDGKQRMSERDDLREARTERGGTREYNNFWNLK